MEVLVGAGRQEWAEKLIHDVFPAESLAEPMGGSGAGLALQSWAKLRRRGWDFVSQY